MIIHLERRVPSAVAAQAMHLGDIVTISKLFGKKPKRAGVCIGDDQVNIGGIIYDLDELVKKYRRRRLCIYNLVTTQTCGDQVPIPGTGDDVAEIAQTWYALGVTDMIDQYVDLDSIINSRLLRRNYFVIVQKT